SVQEYRMRRAPDGTMIVTAEEEDFVTGELDFRASPARSVSPSRPSSPLFVASVSPLTFSTSPRERRTVSPLRGPVETAPNDRSPSRYYSPSQAVRRSSPAERLIGVSGSPMGSPAPGRMSSSPMVSPGRMDYS